MRAKTLPDHSVPAVARRRRGHFPQGDVGQDRGEGRGTGGLVAAAALQPRTLLRAQDVTWQPLTGPALSGVILRPNEATRRDKPLLEEEKRAEVYGAVLRGAVEPGAPITKDLIVKPGERDFLRVVLTPGQRAIAIPVKTGGASAGLLVPGDQVDVILTQKFAEKDEKDGAPLGRRDRRRDLRVLAIDEPKGSKTNMAEQGDFGRTVTLQVTRNRPRRSMSRPNWGNCH